MNKHARQRISHNVKLFLKQADDAPGIPDRQQMGDVSQLQDQLRQLTPYVIQKHLADQAGKHYDLRMQTPEGLLSWAIPKASLPESGQVRKAIRQPLHSKDYKDFEGEIEEGYGKGEVEKEREGNVIITNTEGDPLDTIDFTIAGPRPDRYRLTKQDEDGWMMIGMTPSEKPDHDKVHFQKVDSDQVDELVDKVSEDRPMSVKIDGALGLMKFLDDRAEVMSHRQRKDTGEPIIHTERIAPELLDREDVPEELSGRTLEGEIYATRDGEVLEPQELSGLLNSAVDRARKKTGEEDIDWKMAVFDVLPRDMSDEKKEKIIETAQSFADNFVQKMPEATDPETARELMEDVVGGKHPLSSEGVVFQTPEGKKKYKPFQEHDVVVKGFTPGQGRLEDSIGAIEYALSPEGEVAGRVGTGLSDQMRKQISEDPEQWAGRVARIKAQQQYPSGAFRAPVLLGFHEDYGPGNYPEHLDESSEKQ